MLFPVVSPVVGWAWALFSCDRTLDMSRLGRWIALYIFAGLTYPSLLLSSWTCPQWRLVRWSLHGQKMLWRSSAALNPITVLRLQCWWVYLCQIPYGSSKKRQHIKHRCMEVCGSCISIHCCRQSQKKNLLPLDQDVSMDTKAKVKYYTITTHTHPIKSLIRHTSLTLPWLPLDQSTARRWLAPISLSLIVSVICSKWIFSLCSIYERGWIRLSLPEMKGLSRGRKSAHGQMKLQNVLLYREHMIEAMLTSLLVSVLML